MLPNLKRLRREAGVSQQRLAEAVGVSQQSVNQYENHCIEPDIAVLAAMADFFDTSIDFIVGRTELRRKIEPTRPHELNDAEAELVALYRALGGEERACAIQLMRLLDRGDCCSRCAATRAGRTKDKKNAPDSE